MPDNPIETGQNESTDPDSFRQRALRYHQEPRPGKLEIRATKPLDTQRDLAMAYSPGVAEACLEIKAAPERAALYTGRANLVAVISNGTAALGLGDIGALASKPIMEGKAVLFKKFADIDVFDIEVDEKDPKKLAELIRRLEPTFGAVNLEDVKAPDCFVVERRCRETMGIPVFHDDQHGTAIVVGAAATNALHCAGKAFEKIKVVSTGGGAAGIACLNMLLKLGVKRENVWLVDLDGVVYEGREASMTPEKAAYAQKTEARTLAEVIGGADLFLGLSGPRVLKPEMVATMAERPIVFALANPDPEISPEDAKAARPDVIIATGRSDYPNQVNNVLCFPFIFRGALDVGAKQIDDAMQIACVNAIAELARAPVAAEAARAYSDETMVFGAEYLIPKPFDPRLLAIVASAVAEAAAESGAATRPIEDLDAYRERLNRFVYRSSLLMRPIVARARRTPKRVVYAEGEDHRVLQAANAAVEEGVAHPILIGRPRVIESRAAQLGLDLRLGDRVEVCNPEDDPRYPDYWRTYHRVTEREGVTPDVARDTIRTNPTVIAAVMTLRGEADALICGTYGAYAWHLRHLDAVLRPERGALVGALSALILESGPLFVADAHVHADPAPETLAELAIASAREIRRFGLEPRAAFISRSNFGSLKTPAARKMRRAVALMDAAAAEGRVDFEYEGEMRADAALNPATRERVFPNARLSGPANLLLAPDFDAASALFDSLHVLARGLEVGPILLGMGGRAHIVTSSVTARGILNATSLASAGAGVVSETPA